MFEIAPVFVIGLAWALLYLLFDRSQQDRRSPFLSASIVWGTLLAVITEGLSRVTAIHYFGIWLTWLLVDISLIGIYFYRLKTLKIKPFNFRLRPITSDANVWVGIIGIGIIFILTAVVAIASPPNNWDSMTYHMSRVVNWIQNQNINHYPTHILRQLDLAPWSGYAILHFQILSNGDRLANLVQWGSMVGSVIGVSLIAKQLGANLKGQVLASVLCATIPMGVLQASTTQNDYVVSFWMVCLTWGVLWLAQIPYSFHALCMISLSLGLAILTKATAYIYALPFCIWLLSIGVRHYRYKSWQPILLVGLPVIFLNINFWLRNFEVFGDPLGVAGKVTQNRLFTIQAIASNIIRNLSIHLGSVFTPLNEALDSSILAFHDLISLSAFDPRTTYEGTVFKIPVGAIYDQIMLSEDTAGNFVHLLLILAALLVYISRPAIHSKLRHQYVLTLLLCFLIYNIVLAWQPWASRLHLPIFVLFSSFLGCVYSEYIQHQVVRLSLILMVLIGALPYTFFSVNRPLFSHQYFLTNIESIFYVDRATQYFNRRTSLAPVYQEAVAFLQAQQCKKIGFELGFDSWEYPFWALFHLHRDISDAETPQFESVNVDNPSGQIFVTQTQLHDTAPCAIVVVDGVARETIYVADRRYFKAWSGQSVSIYLTEDLTQPG
jgi:hypothetical protein